MRYLAIDLGDKRTGLAVGDEITHIATPHDVIHAAAPDDRLKQLLRAVEDVGPGALVLGLPLNMDGTEGPAAAKAKQLAAQLTEHTGLKVHLVDERLSSAAADDQMAQSGLTHKQKKRRRDALAAANILRGFFDRPSSD